MKLRKIFTILLIFLLFIPSFCHASDNNIMPLFYDEVSSENVKNFIFDRINTDLNVSISSQRYFVFDDVYSKRYIIVSQSNTNVWGNYMISDYDFSVRVPNGRVYCAIYSVSYDDLSSNKITDFSVGPNDGTFSLTQSLTFPICTRSSFLFCSSDISLGVDIKTQYTVPTCDTYEEMEKQQAVILYANNNYDSTSNILTPFTIKLYNEETVDLFSILLSSSSDYWDSENHCFIIPFSYFDVYCQNNVKYGVYLTLYSDESFIYSEEMFSFDFINDSIVFETGFSPENPPSDSDKIVGSIGDMSNNISSGLNEVNETNKGILSTLQSILNFFNPLSEDFFVYQLINLLIEAIKSLIIPSSDFLNNWIRDLNDWLSARLGILYYPFDLVIDFLTRIGNLNESGTAILRWNNLEIMGATFIPAFSYDLNELLTNDTFKNIHDIYLTVVDVVLYLGLIVLAYNTFVDIFGGKYMDDIVNTVEDYPDYQSKYRQKKELKEKDAKRRPIGMGKW